MNIVYQTVSFFGHWNTEENENLVRHMKLVVEKLIKNYNIKYFLFGGLGNFDEIAWKVVTNLKEKYPHIQRIFIVSDVRQLRISKSPHWLNNSNFESIQDIPISYPGFYRRIFFRNLAMMEISDIVLFYVQPRQNSGAYKTYEQAKRMKKTIFNFYE